MLLTNTYIIIKVKHITIAYNTQTKVLNKRICYTLSTLNLHDSINRSNI